jgi:hypothetical protein
VLDSAKFERISPSKQKASVLDKENYRGFVTGVSSILLTEAL